MTITQTFPLMQRSHGHAKVCFGMSNGQARLRDLSQIGCAKAFLPQHHKAQSEVIFLNTAGGLTDQDQLCYEMVLGQGAHITATTQTAERAYASRGLAAQARVLAQVGAGGRLDWLPQETILFENSNLTRETVIELATDASCLLVESVVLGRHAMGEDLDAARLTDHRMVSRNGKPVWADTVRLDPLFLAGRAGHAVLGDARAFAVVAYVGPDAQCALAPIRRVLDEAGTKSAASAWDGKCIARITAQDGWPLKRQIARVLQVLRDAPLPRVWQLQGV